MPAKKYLPWLIVACALLYVVKSPDSAADNVRHAASSLATAADSLTTFVNRLAR